MKQYLLIAFFFSLVVFFIVARMRLLQKGRIGSEILIKLINNCCGEKTSPEGVRYREKKAAGFKETKACL